MSDKPQPITWCIDCGEGIADCECSIADQGEAQAIEHLAAIEHEQWMAWAISLMNKEVLTKKRIDRWNSCLVPYAELTEEMKEHDRVWARRALAVLRAHLSTSQTEAAHLRERLADAERRQQITAEVANHNAKCAREAENERDQLRADLCVAQTEADSLPSQSALDQVIAERNAARAANAELAKRAADSLSQVDAASVLRHEYMARAFKAEAERDAAVTESNHLRFQLAAATDAERKLMEEWDESRAAQRSIICELQQAMAEVFIHLGPPTDRYTPWREQVITEIDAIRAELSAATAEAGNLRSLLRDARPLIAVEDNPAAYDVRDRIDAAIVHSAVAGET